MTEFPGKNPYRPGVGTPPRYLAGRDGSMRHFRGILRSAPEIPANMRVTGLRGVGKTVLLQRFADIAKQENWVPISVELQAGHNSELSLTKLLERLLDDGRKRISTAERIRAAVGSAVRHAAALNVTWKEVTVSYDPVSAHDRDIAQDLFQTTKLAAEKGYEGVVIMLDEAQVVRDDSGSSGEHPLSMLIACVSTLQRNGLPLGLVLCGLPTLTNNLLRARSYTERMFRGEEIASLNSKEAFEAFAEPLKDTKIATDMDLATKVIGEVEGYPYFIQLWGAELWDAALTANLDTFSDKLLKAIRPDIYRRLDLDFYEPRVQTLTPAEQDILLATVDCGYPPLIVSDLKAASDKTQKNINVLLGRLVEAGVLFRLRKGQYEYTAPKFRQYLERQAAI